MISEVTKFTGFSAGLRSIVAIILVLSFIALLVSVFDAGMLPDYYLLVGIPLYTSITIAVAWLLIDQKRFILHRAPLIFLLLVTALLTIINIYATSSVRTFNDLITAIQSRSSSYVEYSIVAHKDSGVSLDNAQSIGVLSNDPLFDKVSAATKNETPASQRTLDSLADGKNNIESGGLQLVVIRKASLPIIEESDHDFYNSLVVLRTIRVESDNTEQSATADISKPYIIYISGIDTAGQISSVSRSDVNILMVVNPSRRSMLLVNTPRDYYVQLHGTTGLRDKLTHAGIYGIDASIQTLEDLYGVDIQHYIRINFSSLVMLIDTIGPVEVYSEYNFKSYHQGYNTLNSKQALEFARERYSFEQGDKQRGRNQQYVIEAIISKLSQTENSVRLPQIISAIQSSVETDMPESSLKRIVRNQLDDIRPWKVESIAVDGTGAMQPTYSYGSKPLYVILPSSTSLASAKQRITDYLK